MSATSGPSPSLKSEHMQTGSLCSELRDSVEHNHYTVPSFSAPRDGVYRTSALWAQTATFSTSGFFSDDHHPDSPKQDLYSQESEVPSPNDQTNFTCLGDTVPLSSYTSLGDQPQWENYHTFAPSQLAIEAPMPTSVENFRTLDPSAPYEPSLFSQTYPSGDQDLNSPLNTVLLRNVSSTPTSSQQEYLFDCSSGYAMGIDVSNPFLHNIINQTLSEAPIFGSGSTYQPAASDVTNFPSLSYHSGPSNCNLVTVDHKEPNGSCDIDRHRENYFATVNPQSLQGPEYQSWELPSGRSAEVNSMEQSFQRTQYGYRAMCQSPARDSAPSPGFQTTTRNSAADGGMWDLDLSRFPYVKSPTDPSVHSLTISNEQKNMNHCNTEVFPTPTIHKDWVSPDNKGPSRNLAW
ncbi:hypothetical protein V8B97DRAFT_795256 [Scleroderma yunnanense]